MNTRRESLKICSRKWKHNAKNFRIELSILILSTNRDHSSSYPMDSTMKCTENSSCPIGSTVFIPATARGSSTQLEKTYAMAMPRSGTVSETVVADFSKCAQSPRNFRAGGEARRELTVLYEVASFRHGNDERLFDKIHNWRKHTPWTCQDLEPLVKTIIADFPNRAIDIR